MANGLRVWVLALAFVTTTSCTVAPVPQVLPAREPAMPRVGTLLFTDIALDRWMCQFETSPENQVNYVHTKIRPSMWRATAAHSSVIVLNDAIFGRDLPWTVFEETRTYEEYLARFESFSPESPEGSWLRELNDQVRAPLAGLTNSHDPIAGKLIYIYAHMFGYDRDYAASLGLAPVAPHASYAWPPRGLDGTWPESFLYEEDSGIRRPSFKMPGTRTAMANAVYFFIKHFESIGAGVHLSPWREVNGYTHRGLCTADEKSCGLDTWRDLYDTYKVILERVGNGGFDDTRIAVYPTFQLESFVGAENRCVNSRIIKEVKRFYSLNVASGVPFTIGLSTYPSVDDHGLVAYRSRLHHLLDNLDSDTPVACDADGDGVTSPGEGIDPAPLASRVRLPRATPLTIGETSLPPWLTFQNLDSKSVVEDEKLGAMMAITHLKTAYHTVDGSPAYPLEFVAFALGPNWAFPVSLHGGKARWITMASGLDRYWLTPMQPFAGQLILDRALDSDGDWDNDGVPSISVLDSPGHEPVYVRDNCPYVANPSQDDADGDGIGDPCDNCLNIANYAQEDWDQDGFGSACDPDLNNDGLVQEAVDLAVVKQCRGAPIDCLAHVPFPDMQGKAVLIADMDADEDVDEEDVAAWHALAADPRLRASGFACAGRIPCPDPSSVMLRDGETVTIPGPLSAGRTCTLPN